MTDDDPELGPVRWCRKCEEWWPDDAEFWYYFVEPAGTIKRAKGREYTRRTDATIARCRACLSAALSLWRRRERETRRANYAAVPHRCPRHGCPVWLPSGRRLCHSHAGRPTVPMTPKLLWELSTPRPLNPWIKAFPIRVGEL